MPPTTTTFDCQADGELALADPDGPIVPRERYLSGEASAGATYVADRR